MDYVSVKGIVYQLNHKDKTATIASVEILNTIDCVIPEYVMAYDDVFSVTGIKSAVFYQTALRQIHLPPTMQSIGTNAFGCCPKLEIVTCNNLKCLRIGSLAFARCLSLKSVEFTGDVFLSKNCFYNCQNIREIRLNAVETIEANVFNGCKNLQEIYFTSPEQIRIEQDAICFCENLKKIEIRGQLIDNAGILDLAYTGVHVSFKQDS